MPRGRVWGLYLDDNGNPWALQVDADGFADPSRGWFDATGISWFPLPRAWLPRRVVGWDVTGRIQSCVVATVGADLWTGAVNEFFIEGSDGVLYQVNVTQRLEERRSGPPGHP